jgi:hypothetical protein
MQFMATEADGVVCDNGICSCRDGFRGDGPSCLNKCVDPNAGTANLIELSSFHISVLEESQRCSLLRYGGESKNFRIYVHLILVY